MMEVIEEKEEKEKLRKKMHAEIYKQVYGDYETYEENEEYRVQQHTPWSYAKKSKLQSLN